MKKTTKMMASAERIESLRRSYRPKKVNMLLVGESVPASGKFFYLRSAMTTFTARAFEKTYGVIFADNTTFLRFFQRCGCYLEDLSPRAVDAMPPKQRKKLLEKSVLSLSERILELEPDILVAVLRRIAPYVREAIELTGHPAVFRVLPFPGNGHQNSYIDGLAEILKQLPPPKA